MRGFDKTRHEKPPIPMHKRPKIPLDSCLSKNRCHGRFCNYQVNSISEKSVEFIIKRSKILDTGLNSDIDKDQLE